MMPKKVILCVDENEDRLSRRSFQLETWGYRVLRARSGPEALELLEGALPNGFDLLLAELLLPGMDGNELVRRAKALNPGQPALLISGTVSDFDRATAADAFLPKGLCDAAMLRERVKLLVTRRRGPKKALPVAAAQEVAA